MLLVEIKATRFSGQRKGQGFRRVRVPEGNAAAVHVHARQAACGSRALARKGKGDPDACD